MLVLCDIIVYWLGVGIGNAINSSKSGQLTIKN